MAKAAKTIKIEQTGSAIRRHHSQRATLIGLKLNKIGRTAELVDTRNRRQIWGERYERAARDVGIRIALLRVAYARAGFQKEPNPEQVRFIEDSPDSYLKSLEQLLATAELKPGEAWVGVAPHSVRAVPLDYLKTVVGFANERGLVVHMHVAEQTAEVEACIAEYGRSPVRSVCFVHSRDGAGP